MPFHYNIHRSKNHAFRLKTNIPAEITFKIWENDSSTMIATEEKFTNDINIVIEPKTLTFSLASKPKRCKRIMQVCQGITPHFIYKNMDA